MFAPFHMWPGWLLAAAALAGLSLPLWLPALVVRLRNWAFVAMNGDEGMELPAAQHGGAETMRFLYSHPAANLRLRQPGVGLSDLFAYFLSPAHELHQEHVETAHPHYSRVASASRSVLGVPKAELRALARRHIGALLRTEAATASLRQRGWQAVRLEELFFSPFVRLMYELVFREPPSAEAEQLVINGATNVIRTLKWTARRDTAARDQLTAHVEQKLREGCCDWIEFDDALSTRERALYIQGVHLVTGVVQLSEGMGHLFVALAQHPQLEPPTETSKAEPLPASATEGGGAGVSSSAAMAEYLGRAITESLRVWPLFGIAHRITSAPIVVPTTGETIPAETVLCFNFERYQHDPSSFDRPGHFEPQRWLGVGGAEKRATSYIPFGVAGNRPCPAQRMSLVVMQEAAETFHESVQCFSSIVHSRSLPCRGLCMLTSRRDSHQSPDDTLTCSSVDSLPAPPSGWFIIVILALLTVREVIASTWRSLSQLGCMVYSVKEARRLRYAQKIFEVTSEAKVPPH